MAGFDGVRCILLNFIPRVTPKKKVLEVHKTLGEGAFIPILNQWRLKSRVSILWTRVILGPWSSMFVWGFGVFVTIVGHSMSKEILNCWRSSGVWHLYAESARLQKYQWQGFLFMIFFYLANTFILWIIINKNLGGVGMASSFSAYKSSPSPTTDLQLRSTVGLPETRYFFWVA